MIKAVVFDLDGVYFVNGKENFQKNLANLGVSEEDFKNVFLTSDEMNKCYKTGKWSDDKFWSWARNKWKIQPNVDLVKMMIDGYEVNNEVVNLIIKMRRNGYKTLVCSNNFPARVLGLHQRFGFLNDFDTVTLSYKVGETKPSEKIYKEMIRQSEVLPEEIVFADDKTANVEAAAKLGINAFVFEGLDMFINKLEDYKVNIF